MEVFYQITLQIILLLMTDTNTATTSGLQTYFRKNTILGLSPSLVLGFSIAWSLRTAITMHIKTVKKQKVYFGFKRAFFVGLWATFATARRVLSLVCFFAASLGLLDILYHWMCEQYTFGIKFAFELIHPKDQVYLFNMTDTLFWSESRRWFWTDGIKAGSGLDRWNYFEDPNEPTAPSYALYTGFTLKWTLMLFFMLMAFHFLSMFFVKWATSQEFNKERMFNKCIHVLQNLNLCFPFSDWDEKMVSGEEFRQRFSNTELEMACSFAVNFGFSLTMVIPIWFTGMF